VQKEQTIGVSTNRCRGIAAAHPIMRDVEQQPNVRWVRRGEHPLDLVRLLADASNVVMVADGYTEICRAFADLGQQPTKARVVGRLALAPTRPLVDQLQIESARIAQESCVTDVLRDHVRFPGRFDRDVATRQRDEDQPAAGQEVA
jgi:hypothetical protein